MEVGKAKIEKVASNRRILGDDGKVKIVRYSASKAPAAIEAPEGVIDLYVRLVSFWNGDKAIACLTYYACHPQSYYGKGDVTAEFIGLARAQGNSRLTMCRTSTSTAPAVMSRLENITMAPLQCEPS